MKILCFDTSLDKTYIALGSNDDCECCEIKSDDTNYHSAYLIPKIKQMLEDKNLTLKELDALCVNCGPGSFTGIRAALSVAKVMALELDLPVVALNSCEILKSASGDDSIVLLDARRLMYYYYEDSKIELILKDDVGNKIKNKKVICDSGVYRDFSGAFGAEFINYEKQNYPLASVMYKLALEKLNASKCPKEDFAHAKLKANYIQTPPVFTKGN